MNKPARILFDLFLFALVAAGLVFRFSWTNWNEGADLHPDEYGLTSSITGMDMPDSLADYFNTRLSTISPYQKYDLAGNPTLSGVDNRMRWGQWPIIIIRATAEATGNTGYSELRLLGRRLCALADALSLLVIYLIGRRLYNHRTGLLAAALSALAVMQIQQSHFMTTDAFVVLFTALAMYAAVNVAQKPIYTAGAGQTANPPWGWYLLFGVFFGMAVASKINLAVLAAMIVLAAAASVWEISSLKSLPAKMLRQVFVALLLAGLVSILTFRVTQPMTFRATSGDTTLLTLTPNADWVDSMEVAQAESSGVNAGPPGEQWTNRIPLVFPWVNMVVWGLGPLLGITAWAGLIWAAVRMLRSHQEGLVHLLPVFWAGGYFLFMGSRHVMSMRYFLPIYPFLCLLAAWALLEWIERARTKLLPVTAAVLVLLGSLAWAQAFVQAVYLQSNTRVEATRWIFANIPAPITLHLETEDGPRSLPVAANDGQMIADGMPFTTLVVSPTGGQLSSIDIAHIRPALPGQGNLTVKVQLFDNA
ncbi:MAG: glycosyltransferase family 39 protein, partial [Chloroflexi bacterium]|nr:glycosyltransferase family 39 protein [Chloroflexota bacterium]